MGWSTSPIDEDPKGGALHALLALQQTGVLLKGEAHHLEHPLSMTQAHDSKLRLMVVDDESDNLDLLYRTFRRDFEVFKAESAFVALQILDEEEEMGIIISDQRMPKMNGTEFLSLAAERFPDTIRILLTGYTDVEDLVEAINTGKVFKYITKPWNPEDLKTTVHQAAETYRVLKQRTHELHRSLRQESLLNAVMAAIRESLDYRSMLQTIVETLGRTFEADICVLHPVEPTSTSPGDHFSSEQFIYTATPIASHGARELCTCSIPLPHLDAERAFLQPLPLEDYPSCTYVALPLTVQQERLATLGLYRCNPELTWSEEDMTLLKSVTEQAALALSQARLYYRIQQQTEQMRAELAVARQIQSNLLCQKLPELDFARVQACCYPAREVGGDFFEVYMHPQGTLWLAVGDVSGKGVPAALFMTSAISMLRRELAQETPPAPNLILNNLNTSLSDGLVSNNCFITMVLACYDQTSGQLVYANAGHLYPMVWSHTQIAAPSAMEVEPTYLKVRGVPLGILPEWTAHAGTVSLTTGDVFLLTSDGITEATLGQTNATPGQIHDRGDRALSTAMLQQQGLWDMLKQQRGPLDLRHLLATIQSQTSGQEDDQTILSLEVL